MPSENIPCAWWSSLPHFFWAATSWAASLATYSYHCNYWIMESRPWSKPSETRWAEWIFLLNRFSHAFVMVTTKALAEDYSSIGIKYTHAAFSWLPRTSKWLNYHFQRMMRVSGRLKRKVDSTALLNPHLYGPRKCWLSQWLAFSICLTSFVKTCQIPPGKIICSVVLEVNSAKLCLWPVWFQGES